MFTLRLQEITLLFLTLFSAVLAVRSDDVDVNGIEKRAPGWGKRASSQNKLGYLNSVLTDLSRYEMNKNGLDIVDLSKRRPGWGKRSSLAEDLSMDKRRPGWGKRSSSPSSFHMDGLLQKRAPGWGKRNYDIDDEYDGDDDDDNDVDDTTRSKRRPGWGKRSFFDEMETMNKRRPGWGKRTPGWGKRSSMETTSTMKDCSDILASIRLLTVRLSLLKDELSDTCPVQSEHPLLIGNAYYKA